MIYIDSSTHCFDLYMSKHSEPENTVKIELEYCLSMSDVSLSSTDVSVHDNYYVYNLDASAMAPGQYEYRIVDTSTLNVYESGLLYKLSENQENKNISENIVYERD